MNRFYPVLVFLACVLGCGAPSTPSAPDAGAPRAAAADQAQQSPPAVQPRALEGQAPPAPAGDAGQNVAAAAADADKKQEAGPKDKPPAVAPKQDVEDKAEAVPADQAVLEMLLPFEVELTIDGKKSNTQRRFTFHSLESRRPYFHEISVVFPGNDPIRRKVILKAGELVRLPILMPTAVRPAIVFQGGNTLGITALSVTSDGRRVLVGSHDSAILYELSTGAQLRTYEGHDRFGSIWCVAFNPDGSAILTGAGDKKTILRDTETGRVIQVLTGHRGWPGVGGPAAFAPDGTKVATGGGDDGQVILWDVKTGKQLHRFVVENEGRLRYSLFPRAHERGVVGLAFSPDGKQLLTGSSDGTVFLWDIVSGRRVHELRQEKEDETHKQDPSRLGFGAQFDEKRAHDHEVTAVAYSQINDLLLTASTDKTASLWDAKTARRIKVLKGHMDTVHSVAFSSDGRFALTGSEDRTAILWELPSGKQAFTFRGHASAVRSVIFHPDGNQVLTGDEAGFVFLWNISSGAIVRTFKPKTSAPSIVVMGEKTKKLLIGTSEGTVVFWDMEKGVKTNVLKGHKDVVSAAAFSADESKMLTGSLDKSVILWNMATDKPIRTFQGHREAVYSVAFAPKDEQVLSSSIDEKTILWDSYTASPLRHFSGCPAVFSPDGKQVLTGEPKGATFWQTATAHPIRKVSCPDSSRICAVNFSRDGKKYLLGTKGGTTIIYDASSGKKLQAIEHSKPIYSNLLAVISPDDSQLLTASDHKPVNVWDIASAKNTVSFSGHPKEIASVAFAPDSRRVLTCSMDGTVRLWDIATGDELCRLINLNAGTDWAVVTPEGLFDGSKEGREKVFFRQGNGLKIVPLDNFFQDFYYPGLLAAIWRGERPMPGKPFQVSPAPSVKLLVSRDAKSSERSAGSITIDVAVTDQGGGIKAPWLKHNRAPVRANNTLVRKEGKTEHHRFTVSLVPGENHIEARSATADGGVESEPAGINVPFTGTLPDPELYVVVVGINVYAANAGVKNLKYCVADAEGLADLFQKQAAKTYGKVHVTRLLDDKATKEGILKSLAGLAGVVKPQDTLVFFCASHGVTLGQRYFLIPHDLKMGDEDPREDLRKGALAVDELGEPLAAIAALKRVLIFDTCQSGSATSLAGKRNNPFAFRGAVERLNRSQGVYCMAGASATEEAAESRDLKHSLLTYTLLAGAGAVDKGPLANKALAGADRGIDVLDWFRFARQQAPAVYEEVRGKAQNIEISGEDQPGFPLLAPAGK